MEDRLPVTRKTRSHVASIVLLLILLIILAIVSSPQQNNGLLFAVAMLANIYFLLALSIYAAMRKMRPFAQRFKFVALSGTISIGIVLLIALRSMGQLRSTDIVITLLLEALFSWYLIKYLP